MYAFIFRMSKIKAVLSVVVMCAAVTAGVFALNSRETAQTNAVPGTSMETIDKQKEFLVSYGWETSEEPESVEEVLIPTEFDEVYESYNDIQKSQGFDLSEYKGERVKKWVYKITNHPESGTATATLLIKDGKLIGGDISTNKEGEQPGEFAKE